MSKKSKRPQKKVAPPKQSKSEKKPSTGIPFINNIVVVFVFVILVVIVKDANTGYKWMSDTLIKLNMKRIKMYKNSTFEEKQVAKMGYNVQFLNYVSDNTPEDAIILMPPDSIIQQEGVASDFDKHMRNKVWVSYFLYPRKVVFEKEKETSTLYDKATHIAVINGWGYEKLPHITGNRSKHAVFALNL
ncbi:MAG: hypothetical protein KJP21_02280 [Bacteroidia bacterium]|nr:hypothetical protein [Bacteroidia bacterium]NNJ55249.1 hypothetical protein [Bacteroidia bacterium]